MDLIDFEAEVDTTDDKEDFTFSDNDDSFIDDASDISESVYEHHDFQNVEGNNDNVLKIYMITQYLTKI